MTLEKLRPRRDEKEERSRHSVEPAHEDVEQVVLGPVHVLHKHNGGLRGDEVREERAPCGVQAVASRERVQVRRRLEPERQAEDRVSAKAAAHRLGWIVLPQAEVLANDLPKGPVGVSLTVRGAAAYAAE